ncbi:hypothetical protein BHU72_05340 [Desulfuribacillus stibiiarsenatis]|uniref:NAD-dependent epimerase/dehydratase domain-containing protein n=1 Tax=Desulfuribacillus stibiiarsenatis TaxID=1390249 RepID=A0A1E5L5V4_9FIRM|nr:NAD-dependent epimerase/dehydratase family protein [Desulfuribacillus stibiiarsenatis]OEH85510.1 hypothetical protein BHU72_05340 [Desulfuribacillus stibiiarsenatis]
MKVAVTGATGFLGKHLVESLVEKGHHVLAISRRRREDVLELFPSLNNSSGVETLQIDISSNFSLPKDIQIVFHCAGVIDKDDKSLRLGNVTATEHVAKACLDNDSIMIHVSSAGVVGSDTDHTDIDERTPCSPNNAYEKSKYEAEEIVQSYVEKGLNARILRPTIIVGVGRDPHKDSFLHLLKSIKSRKYINIGNGTYNIIPIREVVRALEIIAFTNLPNGEVYIINSPISFKRFCAIVNQQFCIHNRTMAIPFWIGFVLTSLIQGFSLLLRKKSPLTFSRLFALTNQRNFSSNKLLSMTSYQPDFEVEQWVAVLCQKYMDEGLL